MPRAPKAKGTVLQMVPKPPVAEDKEDPPADYSPEALLLDLLERVRAGWRPHKLVVHGVYTDPERPELARHIYWSHGVVNSLEHLGMLDLARHSLLTERNE
jgi:hypothetical protein